MVVRPALLAAILLLAGAGAAGAQNQQPPEQQPPDQPQQQAAPDQPQPQPQDAAHALAIQLGHTIGMAMECAVGENVDGAEAKAEHMVDQAANDQHEDPLELDDRLHDAMAEGRDLVLNGQGDCTKAQDDLKKLQGDDAAN